MKVVFANSAMMPTVERLVLKRGRLQKIPLRVRYGLIFHPTFGPTLIDTGYTVETINGPRSWPLRFYGRLFQPRLCADGQPTAVLARFELMPSDIRHVIVTHFHADHVSGLRQFPNARFIADAQAVDQIYANNTFANVRHGVFPELLPDDFRDRLVTMQNSKQRETTPELPNGFDVFGDGSVLTVPLPGHLVSHFGVYFPQLEQAFLYAADTQWLHKAIMEQRLPGPPASITTADIRAAQASADMVRAFANKGGDVVLCHDPTPTKWDL
jgi:glyoxylase-like metal-dependent hydrolase (beta-lactamase superfamily II)